MTENNSQSFNFWKMLGLYLPIVIISIIIHDNLIDTPHLTRRIDLHNQIISGSGPAPVQYRIFTYYLSELFMRLGMPFKLTYLLWRTFFTLACTFLLHYFLGRWCEVKVCIIGVLFFLAVLPLTYLNYYMQPADLPNLAFFLLGFIFIERRYDVLFAILLFIAMLNRETPVLLPLVWLFYRYDELPVKTLIARFLIFTGISLAVYVLLRVSFGVKQYYSFTSYFILNSVHMKPYLYAVLFFGYPLFYTLYHWKNKIKPKFIQRAVLFIPFFIIVHWIMTIMTEPRLWLPLSPLVIASGIILIFGTDDRMVLQDYFTDIPAPLNPKYKNLLYWIMLGVFIVIAAGFSYYYNRVHLKNLSRIDLSEIYIGEGCICMNEGYVKAAETRFLKAETLNPDNPQLNYILGRFYYKVKPDKEKALKYLYHFKKLGTDKNKLSTADGLIKQLSNTQE